MSLVVKDVDGRDEPALQSLLESLPEYAVRATGRPPGASGAAELLLMLPDGFARDRKWVVALWDGDVMVAVADVLLGYPVRMTAFIGLLAVS